MLAPKHKLAASAFAVLAFLTSAMGLLAFARIARGADGESADLKTAASSGYKFDRQTAAFRSTISAVDSTGSVSAASLASLEVGGRVNVPVSARFTAANQTCKVRLYAYWLDGSTNRFLGCSDEVTLTGSTVQDSSGHYVAPTYVFDSYGAWSLRVVVTDAPDAGTVSFWAGSY